VIAGWRRRGLRGGEGGPGGEGQEGEENRGLPADSLHGAFLSG